MPAPTMDEINTVCADAHKAVCRYWLAQPEPVRSIMVNALNGKDGNGRDIDATGCNHIRIPIARDNNG